MTEEKITTLDELDVKMKEQKERLQQKQKEEHKTTKMEVFTPWTDKMEIAFRENIEKSQKCWACSWQNFGKLIVMMNHIDVMRENLPLPTVVCGRCGALFIPKWVRAVATQAIDQERKIIKQMQPAEMELPGAN